MKTLLLPLCAALLLAGSALAADSGADLYNSQCRSCHGMDGSRALGEGITPLKGQSAAALITKLHGYQNGSFGGPRRQMMENIARNLSDAQITAVAGYAATL